jgi:hypothetical protein
MAINLLGPDSLREFFQGRGRITIANRAPSGTSDVILAAAIVRHGATGLPANQMAWELDLLPGESDAIEPDAPPTADFAGVEIVLRLFSSQRGFRQVYLASDPNAAPAREWEAGIRGDDVEPEVGDLSVPEGPGLVAYFRALSP